MSLHQLWTASTHRLQSVGRREIRFFLVVFFFLLAVFLFAELTDQVTDGDTKRFDEWVLRSLRQPDDPAVPIGPPWLREAGLDATALGSPLVLALVVGCVAGYMLLCRYYRVMWLTLFTVAGGAGLSALLKGLIERARPTLVPRLREVSTPSFPSGHAMVSAVVYLTLGMLLMQLVRGRLTKAYCLFWAMFLTFIIGVSRVYLGVHYPTDVLAGWLVGSIWALFCWLIGRYLRRKRVVTEKIGQPE